MKQLVVVVSVFVAACGGSSGTTVTLVKQNQDLVPDVLAFKDGSGPWQELPAGTLTFTVDSDTYSVLDECTWTTDGTPTAFFTYRDDRTTADPTTVVLGCDGDRAFSNTSALTVHATGTMVQPGMVDLGWIGSGTANSSLQANWAIDAETAPMTTQLAATSADHVQIQHDLMPTGDTLDVGTIDVVANGAPFGMANLTVDGIAASDQVETAIDLVVGGAHIFGDSIPDATQLRVVPDAQLKDTDTQALQVSVTDGQTGDRRGVLVDWRSSQPTHYTLLAPVPKVVVNGVKLSWSAYADQDQLDSIQYWLEDYGGTPQHFAYVAATPAALAGAMAIDGDMSQTPHYDPAHQPTAAAQATVYFAHYLDDKFDAVYAETVKPTAQSN